MVKFGKHLYVRPDFGFFHGAIGVTYARSASRPPMGPARASWEELTTLDGLLVSPTHPLHVPYLPLPINRMGKVKGGLTKQEKPKITKTGG